MCKCGRVEGDCTGIHKLSNDEFHEWVGEPVELWTKWKENLPQIMRNWINENRKEK